MSNRSDPKDVRPPIALGWCGCHGTPHDTDYVTIVQQLGYGDIGATRQVARSKGVEAHNQVLIALAVKAWTFVLPDGNPRPIDADEVARLDERTVNRLLEDDVLGLLFMDEESPPNGPSAPSLSGSAESATSIPTSPAPDPSTTS